MIEFEKLYNEGVVKEDNFTPEVQSKIDEFKTKMERLGFKKKIKVLKEYFEIEDTNYGMIIAKPKRKEILKFQSKMSKFNDRTKLTFEENETIFNITLNFIEDCIIYPEKEVFEEFIDEYPLFLDRLIGQISELTGMRLKN